MSSKIIMMSIKLMLWRSYNKHSTSTVETMSDYVLSSKVKTNKILGIKSVWLHSTWSRVTCNWKKASCLKLSSSIAWWSNRKSALLQTKLVKTIYKGKSHSESWQLIKVQVLVDSSNLSPQLSRGRSTLSTPMSISKVMRNQDPSQTRIPLVKAHFLFKNLIIMRYKIFQSWWKCFLIGSNIFWKRSDG